jgi:SHS2 domain-containing protein
MAYKFIEHTADVKFQASGKTLEDAFNFAFFALKETIAGDIIILPQIKKQISINGTDISNLLYNFLEEFLVLLDSESFLASKIENIEIDQKNFTLKATVSGDKAENYSFTNDVKAVTYNEMFAKQDENSGEWLLQVVLDV